MAEQKDTQEVPAFYSETETSLRLRIDTANTLAWDIRNNDRIQARQIAQRAYDLANAEHTRYMRGIADSLRVLGYLNWQQKEYTDALISLLDSLERYSVLHISEEAARVRYLIGCIYADLEDYNAALSYLRDAYGGQDNSSPESQLLLVDSLMKIGEIYQAQGEHKKALTCFLHCQPIVDKLNDSRRTADLTYATACAYYDMATLDTARERGVNALNAYKALKDTFAEIKTLTLLGDIALATSNDSMAYDYYETAVTVAQAVGYDYPPVDALLGMGAVYTSRDDSAEAVMVLQRAVNAAASDKATHKQYHAVRALARARQKQGDVAGLLRDQEQALALADRVRRDEHEALLHKTRVLREVDDYRHQSSIQHVNQTTLKQEIDAKESAERRLTEVKNQLESEIGRHQALIVELDAFAHTVAHDLKSPLSLIQGFGGLLADTEMTPDLDDDSRYAIQQIMRSADKMTRIIDDLLLFASVRDQDQVKFYPLQMNNIIEEVEARLQYDIEQAKAEIVKPEKWPRPTGYAPWVEAVWANYISNAIKYGGTPPRLQLGFTPLEDNMLRFWVRDNGDGVKADVQAQLFGEFTRFDQKRAAGHGIGLSIVKRIITRLGGEVGVESTGRPGQGSTFYFTLPRAEVFRTQSKPNAPTAP